MSKINRLEIIDRTKDLDYGGGRTVIVGGPAYDEPDDKQIELDYQDNGRTLKIFITKKENDD